jgi:hypothetical protein
MPRRFNIGSSGQQIHITDHIAADPESTRHPCFKINSREELEQLKKSIYDHHVRGGPAAPLTADKPGEVDSGQLFSFQKPPGQYNDYLSFLIVGTKGKEYPTRFFARDYAGNRLEFSL